MLWAADTFVDFDHSLNTSVIKLRDALGDSADAPLYIETVPKRGYRFIAPVSVPVTAQMGVASPGRDSASPAIQETTEPVSDPGVGDPAPHRWPRRTAAASH